MRFQFFFYFVLLVSATSAAKDVPTLPGYEGPLPFKFETGYVTPDNPLYENQRLFYYFAESQNDSSTDPILFWVSGGPGYSSLWGFFFEIGPLNFNLTYTFDGSGTLPQLLDNPYAWTKFMSILFVDAPAGTGFSYATTPEAYYTSHFDFAETLTGFIHQWLKDHESFQSNPFYISGDGFSGNPLPITMDYILHDNERGILPYVNFQGYILIGPGADFDLDFNSRFYFLNRVGLIEDDIFEEAKTNCNGEFLKNTTEACTASVDLMEELVENINFIHTLEPACHNIYPNIPSISTNPLHRSLQENSQLVSYVPDVPDYVPGEVQRCRKFNHELCIIWANTKIVQDALGVEPGTKPSDQQWEIRNTTVDHVSYNKDDISNVVPYHKNLTKYNLRGLILNGDHGVDIPFNSIQQWIKLLELPLVERWRVVTVSNETAGYTKKYENEVFSLTYVLVKGGGHLTPEHRPRECYHMAYNWTTGLDL